MTKNPSGKLSEVFVLIIPKMIRIQISEWEPRRGVRILVLIIPQMIRLIHFSEWEEVART
jgi:hypothetical protein